MVSFPFGINGGKGDMEHDLHSGWGPRCGREFSEYACSVFCIALAPAETVQGREAAPSGVDRGQLEAGAGNTVDLPALWLLFLPT